MPRTLQISLLTAPEWERLVTSTPRYQHGRDSLGFADPQSNRAYIRSTVWPELNRYLIDHEVDHLLEEQATDEDEFGLRHKKVFKDVVRNVAAVSAAPFTAGASLALGSEKLKEPARKILPKELVDAYPALYGAAGTVLGGGPLAGFGAGLGRAAKESLEQPDPNASLNQRLLSNVPKSALGGFAAGTAVSGATSLLAKAAPSLASFTKPGGITNLGGPAAAGSGVSRFSAAPQAGATAGAPPGAAGPGKLAGRPLKSFGLPSLEEQMAINRRLVSGAPTGSLSGPLAANATPLQPLGGSPQALSATGSAVGTRLAASTQAQNRNPQPPTPSGAPQPTVSPAVLAALQGSRGGTAAGGPSAQPVASPAPSALSQFFPGGLGNAAIAAGLVGVGESRQSPSVPDFGDIPSIQQLRDTAGQPQSEVGKLAQARLSEQLTVPSYGGLSESLKGDMRRTFDRRRNEVASQFKLYRPNADLATDTAFRQAMQDIDRDEAGSIAQAEQQDRQQFEGNRRTDIASALGVDEQTLNELVNLAQLDVDELTIQLGIDAADAQAFKERFGQLASLFGTKALGLNQFQLQPVGAANAP